MLVTPEPDPGEIVTPDRPLSDIPSAIGAPARRALAAAGYQRLEQLTVATDAELTALDGVGQTAVLRLKRALDEQGLASAPPVPTVLAVEDPDREHR